MPEARRPGGVVQKMSFRTARMAVVSISSSPVPIVHLGISMHTIFRDPPDRNSPVFGRRLSGSTCIAAVGHMQDPPTVNACRSSRSALLRQF